MIRHPRLVAIFIIAVVLTGLSVSAWVLMEPEPDYLQGEVEATTVNVSAKIPGRVEVLPAEEGEQIAAGAVVAELDSVQLQAKRQQAEAAQEAAGAQYRKAKKGAREQEIRAAYNKYLEAQAGTDLARKSYDRVERLYTDGVVPAQRRDEVKGKYEMTMKLMAAAKAMYDMAVAGAREEDKAAAGALVDKAGGAVAEVMSYIAEAEVRAPVGGEVYEHVVNVGELASAGMPLVTLVDLDDVWVTFNVREDRLGGLAMGDTLEGQVPALDFATVTLRVTYIAALGEFAMWRATSAQGGFDLRTFEVRAEPVTPVEGLRPGMSMLVPWNSGQQPEPLGQWRDWLPAWLTKWLPERGDS
ncbi:MAG: HlyD family secretion protein [Candidatus Hydrogenedentota bacterium]